MELWLGSRKLWVVIWQSVCTNGLKMVHIEQCGSINEDKWLNSISCSYAVGLLVYCNVHLDNFSKGEFC